MLVDYLILGLIAFIAWAFGVFAFAQIIGCIRTKSHLFAFVFWTVIVIVASVLVILFLSKYMWAYYIALGISLVQILAQRNIE